jgi:hypothetical protein
MHFAPMSGPNVERSSAGSASLRFAPGLSFVSAGFLR